MEILLSVHSIIRWIFLMAIIYTIYRALMRFTSKKSFTKLDNSLRHWTATIAHIQLIVGMILYLKSPITQLIFQNFKEGIKHNEVIFFGLVHISLMLIAIVVITIGSSLAKRKPSDHEKFKTVLIWFGIALIIILIAIPWPFSPLAQRPYFRPF